MEFPTYKHLEASVDYLVNASGYTLEQVANKHNIPVLIVSAILAK